MEGRNEMRLYTYIYIFELLFIIYFYVNYNLIHEKFVFIYFIIKDDKM